MHGNMDRWSSARLPSPTRRAEDDRRDRRRLHAVRCDGHLAARSAEEGDSWSGADTQRTVPAMAIGHDRHAPAPGSRHFVARLPRRRPDHADAHHYRLAARRLAKMRTLAAGTNQLGEVDAFITGLRDIHRRRPRLQQEFDRARLP
jgi:hypothetical protein